MAGYLSYQKNQIISKEVYYSDDVYKEQEKIIKTQLAKAESVLGQTIFDKYTIDDIDAFMKEKFSDLGKTYKNSNPGERRVLLGSIAPSGLAWQYPGLSNQQFSKEYQAILDVQTSDFAMSTPSAKWFELFYTEVVAYFTRFMEAYQMQRKENG